MFTLFSADDYRVTIALAIVILSLWSAVYWQFTDHKRARVKAKIFDNKGGVKLLVQNPDGAHYWVYKFKNRVRQITNADTGKYCKLSVIKW